MLNIWLIKIDSVATFFLPLTRIWELLLGAIIAYALNEEKISCLLERRYGLNNYISFFGLIFIFSTFILHFTVQHVEHWVGTVPSKLTLFVLNYKIQNYPGWFALMPTLGAALFIAAGDRAWLNRKVFSNTSLVYLGLISYPLYLWHWPLLSFTKIVIGDELSVANTLVILVISILLSILTYEMVEKRYQEISRKKLQFLIFQMAFLVLIATTILFFNGFPNREFIKKYDQNYKTILSVTKSDSYCEKISWFTQNILELL